MQELPHLKESIFGSAEDVKKINECIHEFEPCEGLIFEFIHVYRKCTKCKTYSNRREQNE